MNRIQPGDRINNYLLDERIGAGTFGEVYKAHHHLFHTPAAIKIPTDPGYVRYLKHEAATAHRLDHPNIVRVLDADPYADPPYLIMEYVDGPSLASMIEQYPQGLPIEAAVAITFGLLSALEAAHRANVIHRDVKPANILLAPGPDARDARPAWVKVTDFGLGRTEPGESGSMVQSGSLADPEAQRVAGTLVYMSPEQREGQSLDARSDLYALGVVLHEMLTGRRPEGSDLPGSHRKDVPRWLDHLFERTYAGLERRYATAAEIQGQICRHWPAAASWTDGQTAPPSPPPRRAEPRRPCPKCGQGVDAHDLFCIHCGQQLSAYLSRCPCCHEFVGRSDNFCIHCGCDLRTKVELA